MRKIGKHHAMGCALQDAVNGERMTTSEFRERIARIMNGGILPPKPAAPFPALIHSKQFLSPTAARVSGAGERTSGKRRGR